jgi:hypothetical protein
MVKQQSPRARPAEHPSGSNLLIMGIASRIALPFLLLVSWLLISALLGNGSSKEFVIHKLQFTENLFYIGTLLRETQPPST